MLPDHGHPFPEVLPCHHGLDRLRGRRHDRLLIVPRGRP